MVVVLVTFIASAGAAPAPADAAGKAATARLLKGSADWQHARQVVADLKASPPQVPLVVMFGTSTTRESTITDASWSKAIGRAAGTTVKAYNLGSTNQTFTQDRALVGHLPEVPTVVFIGIDVVRFVAAPSAAAVTLPSPRPVPASYDQHRYSVRRILSAAKKRVLVRDWVKRRYRVFLKNYRHNLGELRLLIEECRARGLYPVLIEAPRNTAAIKSAFNKAVRKYRTSCRALAARHGIPYIDFLSACRFRNRDFYDVWHAVEPGRRKWQPRLSAHIVRLLRRYGMVPAT
jgi:hypothetical protein